MQGVDRWQLKVQRAADKKFDKFEMYALQNIFAVPDNLQFAPPEAMATEEDTQLDAEREQLWVQLQQALVTKRELQRKLSAAQATTTLWEEHRETVKQLAASHQSNNIENALNGVQQLNSTLQDGWTLVRPSAGAAASAHAHGPRGLQQRFTHRRARIGTVNANDLLHLTSLLTAEP